MLLRFLVLCCVALALLEPGFNQIDSSTILVWSHLLLFLAVGVEGHNKNQFQVCCCFGAYLHTQRHQNVFQMLLIIQVSVCKTSLIHNFTEQKKNVPSDYNHDIKCCIPDETVQRQSSTPPEQNNIQISRTLGVDV